VTTTCSPASGAVFPVGATTVSCTARDALSRTAVCSLTVTLVSSHLSAMSFVAFGDRHDGRREQSRAAATWLFRHLHADLRPGHDGSRAPPGAGEASYIDLASAYPTQLLGMLNARFAGEAFTMDNEGLPGRNGARWRLASSPCVFPPGPARNVLLLLEGTNEFWTGLNYTPTASEEQSDRGY